MIQQDLIYPNNLLSASSSTIKIQLQYELSSGSFMRLDIFSGILFQSDLFDKIIKMEFVNVSFIFLIGLLLSKI